MDRAFSRRKIVYRTRAYKWIRFIAQKKRLYVLYDIFESKSENQLVNMNVALSNIINIRKNVHEKIQKVPGYFPYKTYILILYIISDSAPIFMEKKPIITKEEVVRVYFK